MDGKLDDNIELAFKIKTENQKRHMDQVNAIAKRTWLTKSVKNIKQLGKFNCKMHLVNKECKEHKTTR